MGTVAVLHRVVDGITIKAGMLVTRPSIDRVSQRIAAQALHRLAKDEVGVTVMRTELDNAPRPKSIHQPEGERRVLSPGGGAEVFRNPEGGRGQQPHRVLGQVSGLTAYLPVYVALNLYEHWQPSWASSWFAPYHRLDRSWANSRCIPSRSELSKTKPILAMLSITGARVLRNEKGSAPPSRRTGETGPLKNIRNKSGSRSNPLAHGVVVASKIYRRDWSETPPQHGTVKRRANVRCYELNTLLRSPSSIPMKPPTALSLAGRGTRAGSSLAALSYILSIADAELFFANPANRLYRMMQYNARTASRNPIFLPSS